MPSADQVPVKKTHSKTMRWHEWVVLIAGSTALHYVLFALPTFTLRRLSGAISLSRKRDGFLASRAGFLGRRYRRGFALRREQDRILPQLRPCGGHGHAMIAVGEMLLQKHADHRIVLRVH